jgi:uncharacterized protein
MATDDPVHISVVYALAQRQVIVELDVPQGTTVADAVARSGLVLSFPQIESKQLACAIHGRAASLTAIVRAGDRIEILRPLLIDPKEQRRQAAAQAKRR